MVTETTEITPQEVQMAVSDILLKGEKEQGYSGIFISSVEVTETHDGWSSGVALWHRYAGGSAGEWVVRYWDWNHGDLVLTPFGGGTFPRDYDFEALMDWGFVHAYQLFIGIQAP